MMMYLNIFLTALILVYGIDILGFVEEMKIKLFKFVKGKNVIYKPYSLRPFDCSLCLSFWVGILILIFNLKLTIINIAYVCMISFFAPQYKDVLLTVQDMVQNIINFFRIYVLGEYK